MEITQNNITPPASEADLNEASVSPSENTLSTETGLSHDAGMLEGIADCCELLAASFRFPGTDLARALSDCSYTADVRTCFADARIADERTAGCISMLASFEEQDVDDLLSRLKKGNSILFLSPGHKVPVWPYEAPFRFVAAGREGVPSLFRSPIAIDVESTLRASDHLPSDYRKEPVDSIWNEFEFLSFLLGKAAQEANSDDDTLPSFEVARLFFKEHLGAWAPDFMDKVIVEAPLHSFGKEYAALANVGKAVLEKLAELFREQQNDENDASGPAEEGYLA